MQEYYPKFEIEKVEPPGDEWYYDFMKRNDMIHILDKPIEKERAENATVGNIKNWFERFSLEIPWKDVDEHMVGNLDETVLATNARSIVCVKRGTREAETIDFESKDHITILHTVVNGGATMKPLFIYQLKQLPTYFDDLVKTGKIMVSGQKKGWINDVSFQEYMMEFVKWVGEYRKTLGLPSDAKFVLFGDSHQTRKDADLMLHLKNNNIIFVTFPSHTTHILQPLDVGVFGVFKQLLRKQKRRLATVEFKWKGTEPSEAGKARVIDTLAAIEALHQASTPLTINNAFRRTGLVPFDVDQALMNPRISPNEEVTINNRKRKGLQIDNQVVTSDAAIKALREDEVNTPKKTKSQKL